MTDDWRGMRVVVAGLGIAGYACADALLQLGATVKILDGGDSEAVQKRAEILRLVGAHVVTSAPTDVEWQADVLVVSPGLPPRHPWIVNARLAAVPVWGELELAWRLRAPDAPPWLTVTGTNGKTTTTLMLASMLAASGEHVVAAGNIGVPLVDVVMHDRTATVLAIEVGAPQLPFVVSMSPVASVCLNLAPDHLDLFGGMSAYADAKGRIYRSTQVAAVYNVADRATESMVEEAEVVEGCRAIGFTLGVPAPSMLGVVDEYLVDRAFLEDRRNTALELASLADVRPFAPHNVANALAAAALARAFGAPPAGIGAGLRAFRPAGHRIEAVGSLRGIDFVDDSKATNAHAAQASLGAYDPVVWVAGGLAKGQTFDDLVVTVRDRLQGVVLLGADRAAIAAAVARHAPDIPVIEVSRTDTGAMDDVVAAAISLARPPATVLLAPACASWDMFSDYGARGSAFAAAVGSATGHSAAGDVE